jgi:hypothetical protein
MFAISIPIIFGVYFMPTGSQHTSEPYILDEPAKSELIPRSDINHFNVRPSPNKTNIQNNMHTRAYISDVSIPGCDA